MRQGKHAMRKSSVWVVAALAALSWGVWGCDSGGGGGGGDPAGIGQQGESCAATADCVAGLECVASICGGTDDPVIDPDDPGPVHTACGYDDAQRGKVVGKHIKNFGLKTWEGDSYWLHQANCGQPETKVVWVVLATGW